MDGWFQVEVSESTSQIVSELKLRFRPRTLRWTNNKKTAFPRCWSVWKKGENVQKKHSTFLKLEAFFGHPKRHVFLYIGVAADFPDPQLTPQYSLQVPRLNNFSAWRTKRGILLGHHLPPATRLFSQTPAIPAPPRRWTLDIWRWYGKGDLGLWKCLYISNIQIYIYIYIVLF